MFYTIRNGLSVEKQLEAVAPGLLHSLPRENLNLAAFDLGVARWADNSARVLEEDKDKENVGPPVCPPYDTHVYTYITSFLCYMKSHIHVYSSGCPIRAVHLAINYGNKKHWRRLWSAHATDYKACCIMHELTYIVLY